MFWKRFVFICSEYMFTLCLPRKVWRRLCGCKSETDDQWWLQLALLLLLTKTVSGSIIRIVMGIIQSTLTEKQVLDTFVDKLETFRLLFIPQGVWEFHAFCKIPFTCWYHNHIPVNHNLFFFYLLSSFIFSLLVICRRPEMQE